eukprot:TRINITY_DN5059_c0_g1_i1.p1 TRINITY_DN5059_c0_g1~~TRINITY_DN5059_c0_g1_i1.p1  ORF type:complete len:635 (+),score=178.03 TRINITY_DN5059_c0_g1_i1:66-1970(+)
MAAGGGVPQFASLYVGDLHLDVTEAMLYEIFNSVGPVASIRVCRDSVSRKSLGYGYINFHSVSDAERALDTLNYSAIKGRSCRLMWSQRDPSLRKAGTGNIYIKNLDKNIDNKALYDTFSLFGNILSCKVASDAATGTSYGYGFVQYETQEAAKQAIERVNGMQIGEKTVEVYAFQKRDDRDTTDSTFTNLYVKNLKPEWTDEDKIKEAFEQYGAVTSAALRTDPQGRKFAFVNFEKNEDAKKSIEGLHMTDVSTEEEKEGEEKKADADGHPAGKLYVQRAQSKKERALELKKKFASSDTSKQGVNLYIKNLDESTDEASMRELFEPFGVISSLSVKKDDQGKCKGFAFVCFASPDEATKAVTEMHLKVVKGKPLYVGLAERREVRDERLRQRYSAPIMGGKDGKGGKGFKGGKCGKGGGMDGGMGMMGGMGGGMGMTGGPGMMGMTGMMPMGGGMQNPMMGMKGMQNPMMGMNTMGGKPGMMPAMGGKPGMMPNPMMGMGKGMPGPMGPMGMMRPTMPMPMMQQMMAKGGMPGGCMGGPQQKGQPGQQLQQMQQPQTGGAPLSAATLAAAAPAVQKQMIGEKLYPAIAKMQPQLAGKITGMMLEMDNSELLMLLESEQQMRAKVEEALQVLQK